MLNWIRQLIGSPPTTGTRSIREDKLQALLDEIDSLSRDMKSIRLEWAETEESVNRALRKLGKRAKRAEQEEEGADADRLASNLLAEAHRIYGSPWGHR